MTGRRLGVVVPSRGRPEAAAALADAFQETCTATTLLLLVVDEDDPRMAEYFDAATLPAAVHVCRGAGGGGMSAPANEGARHLANLDMDAVGFMGDDHRPRTVGWDSHVLDACGEGALAYGDDLNQGARLPTAAFMPAEWVRRLGFLCPPRQRHLYLDDFWLELGKRCGIRYLPGVVIEHMHPTVGKAEWDEGYQRVNAGEMYEHDRAQWEEFLDKYMDDAVRRVLHG